MLQGINSIIVGVEAESRDSFDGMLKLQPSDMPQTRHETYRWKRSCFPFEKIGTGLLRISPAQLCGCQLIPNDMLELSHVSILVIFRLDPGQKRAGRLL